MIYLKTSEEISSQLNDFSITDNPENAYCAVIEMPGHADILNSLPENFPIYVIVTGMLTFSDLRLIKKPGIVKVQMDELKAELIKLQEKIIASDTPADNNEDELIILEDDNEEIMFIDDEPPAPQPIEQQQNTQSNRHFNTAQQAKYVNPKPPQKETTRRALFQKPGRKAVICVSFSSEGGVGKTFIASNVAAAVSLSGIQSVAVDLDLGYGDLDTAVGLADPSNREKIIDKKAKVPDNGWATVADWRQYAVNLKQNILQHNSGLYVMPAYPYAGYDISQSEVEDMLYTLSEAFGFVMVDLGVDGFSPHARVALNMADVVLLVGGQSEKTIGKISHFLKQEGGYNDKMHLVINKVSPLGYYSAKEVAQKLGFSNYHEVPNDKKGVNAAKKRRKLAVQLPGCDAGDAVKQYAAATLPFNLEVPVKQTKETLFSKFKGLFKRR